MSGAVQLLLLTPISIVSACAYFCFLTGRHALLLPPTSCSCPGAFGHISCCGSLDFPQAKTLQP